MNPEARLRELGLELPPLPPAVGNYVGAVSIGSTLFVAGHGPFKDGKPQYLGKLGRDFSVEEGQQAAKLVMLNMLATVKHTIGSLERIKRVAKLLCMVNSMPDFHDQPQVANGAIPSPRESSVRNGASTRDQPSGWPRCRLGSRLRSKAFSSFHDRLI